MSERRLRIKGLGTFIIERGQEIQWYDGKDKNEVLSGVIMWYTWRRDKQIGIKGTNGKFYRIRLYRDRLNRKWGYRVEEEEESD